MALGEGCPWVEPSGCDYIIPITRKQYAELMRPEADEPVEALRAIVLAARPAMPQLWDGDNS